MANIRAVSLNELIDFLREESGNFETEITANSLIEDDLGITGDDGYDLIQSFAKRYSVDISNFQYSNYFYPEPNFFDEPKKVIPLTVDDLLNAIKQSKLQ